MANIGVHGAPAPLHLEELWIKNITITTGVVDGTTVPTLLQLASSGEIRAVVGVSNCDHRPRCGEVSLHAGLRYPFGQAGPPQ